MKKILTTLFISIAFNTIVFAQYTEIPLPFPDTTRCKVQFVDEMHGWVSSWTGTILHTTNGGTTWDKFDSPHPNKISHINFCTTDYGIIWADTIGTGRFGKLYRTTDGGMNWKKMVPFDSLFIQANLSSTNYWYEYAIKTTAPNHIAIRGERIFQFGGGGLQSEDLFISTMNDGITWQTQPESTYLRVHPVFLPLDTTTWAILEAAEDIPNITPISGFRLSTDKGKTWRFTNVWIDRPTLTAEFTDSKHGMIFHRRINVGGGISVTRDGGETWDNWEFLPTGFSGRMINDTTVYYIGRWIIGDPNKPNYGDLWRVIDPKVTSGIPNKVALPFSVYSISSIGEKVFALTIDGRLFVIDNTIVSVKKTISSITTSFDFEIYPNPTSGAIQMLPRIQGSLRGSIEVYNSLGERLFQTITLLNDQEFLTLDLKHLYSGQYFLLLKNTKNTIIKPFVIIK